MMPDPWATYSRPSTEEGQPTISAPPETTSCVPANKGASALTKGFREARSRSATRNVETRNRDRTQKRRELVNTWRAEAKSGALGSTRKRSATPPRQEGCSRVPSFRRKKKEDFEKDFGHKAVYNGKVDENSLQGWTDEMQSKVQKAERELEAGERKRMEIEDFSSQQRRTWEKLEEIVAFSVSATALKSS